MSFFDTNIAPLPLEIYITIEIFFPGAPVCITIEISEWDIDLDIEEWGIDLSISEWNISLELECDGTPSQGETYRVTGTLIDLDGNPVTGGAAVHAITTYNPSGTLVDTEAGPTEVGAGVWYQNINLAADAPIGGWRVFWAVTLGGTVGIVKLPFWVDDP